MTDSVTALQWRRLRGAGAGSASDLAIASTELEAITPAGPLRLAIGSGHQAMLLMPLGVGEGVAEVAAGPELEVRETVLRLRGAPIRFIAISCLEPRLEGVFEDLVDSVIERVARGEPSSQALRSTIGEFRQLLARARDASSSVERMIGLLAELRTLNALLEISATAWRTWAGPAGGRHDFRSGAIALECKATLRSQGARVTIASIDQLVPPEGGRLFLQTQTFETDPSGAYSVATESRRALDLASDDAEVLSRLAATGCDPRDPVWQTRFSLLDEAVHGVVDGFPRVVPGSLAGGRLPAGVTALSYQIDPGASAAPPLDDIGVFDIFREIANAA